MFRLFRNRSAPDPVGEFHACIVDAARRPELYGTPGLPDTVEGRFESLTLHMLLVLRRLRHLPAPAAEVAQDLVDAVFAHLEITLRETGVGDFGVPKRMKKLGQAFYDRVAKYDPFLDAGDADGLATEIAGRTAAEPETLRVVARSLIAGEANLAGQDLDGLIRHPDFAAPSASTLRAGA